MHLRACLGPHRRAARRGAGRLPNDARASFWRIELSKGAKAPPRLEACLHGVLQALNVAHGHGQRGVSNQPERLDRWYSMAQPYAQPQAGIRSESDAAVHE